MPLDIVGTLTVTVTLSPVRGAPDPLLPRYSELNDTVMLIRGAKENEEALVMPAAAGPTINAVQFDPFDATSPFTTVSLPDLTPEMNMLHREGVHKTELLPRFVIVIENIPTI